MKCCDKTNNQAQPYEKQMLFYFGIVLAVYFEELLKVIIN